MRWDKDVRSRPNSRLKLGEDILDIRSCPKCGRAGCLMLAREGLRKRVVQRVLHRFDDVCDLDVWWDADSEMWIGCDPDRYFDGCKCSKCLSSDRRNSFFTKESEGKVDIDLSVH